MAGFDFKQFKIQQNNTAMKVSTDGIILGAWASLTGVERILDIGTGTGLLALMCKQRCEQAKVQAVEIEQSACIDARANFSNSPWCNDIHLFEGAIQDFEANAEFDLVITNPPYFNDSLKAQSSSRNLARHTDSLSFEALILAYKRLSHAKSRLAIILPNQESELFKQIAQQQGLFLKRICEVRTKRSKPVSRQLMEFANEVQNTVEHESLCIHDNGVYSNQFVQLCKAFYLKM